MSIVGIDLQEEWKDSSDGWYVNNKNNTNLANLDMMSIVLINIHDKWMECWEWRYVNKTVTPIMLT